jgi:hypothetical protein
MTAELEPAKRRGASRKLAWSWERIKAGPVRVRRRTSAGSSPGCPHELPHVVDRLARPDSDR